MQHHTVQRLGQPRRLELEEGEENFFDEADIGDEDDDEDDENTGNEQLYALQLQQRAQQETIRALQMQLAQAKKPKPRKKKGTASSASTPRTSTTADAEPGDADPDSDTHELAPQKFHIRGLGRKYCVFYKPWAPPEEVYQLVAHVSEVNPYDPTTRYLGSLSTPEAKEAALHRAYAVQVSRVMTPLIRPLITNEYVIGQFAFGIHDHKSKIFAAMRKKRAHLFSHIPDINPLILLGSDNQMELLSDDERCQFWRGSEDPNNLYVPIIFPESTPDEPEMKYIFKSMAIAKFIRVMLFGEGALQHETPSSRSSGMKWGVKKLTFGMVAFAAVGVRYMLSPDPAFEVEGQVTKTQYATIFDEYLKTLIEYGDKPRVVGLLKWLERIVFRGVKGTAAQQTASSRVQGGATRMDPRDLQDLEGDMTVELDEQPDLSDDANDDNRYPQSSASNRFQRQAAAATPSPATVPRASAPAPRATTGDVAAGPTSSQVSYIAAVPPRSTSTASGGRIRPTPVSATSSSHVAPAPREPAVEEQFYESLDSEPPMRQTRALAPSSQYFAPPPSQHAQFDPPPPQQFAAPPTDLHAAPPAHQLAAYHQLAPPVQSTTGTQPRQPAAPHSIAPRQATAPQPQQPGQWLAPLPQPHQQRAAPSAPPQQNQEQAVGSTQRAPPHSSSQFDLPPPSAPRSQQLAPPSQRLDQRATARNPAPAADSLAQSLADVALTGRVAYREDDHAVLPGVTLPTPVDAGPGEDAPRVAAAPRKGASRRGGRKKGNAPSGVQEGSEQVVGTSEPGAPEVATVRRSARARPK